MLLHGADEPGYVTILVAVIGMGDFQAMSPGLIGEYVGRMHHESKNRPHYLTKETFPAAGRLVRVVSEGATGVRHPPPVRPGGPGHGAG